MQGILANRIVLATTLMLGCVSVARADFKRSYTDGLEAVRDGRWAEVQGKMNQALSEEATPIAKMKLYGMRFEPYVPRYYLGLAAYRQGNCAEALRQWRDPATQGIVQANPTLSGLAEAGTRDCERKVADTTPPATTPSTTPTTPSTSPSTTPSTTPVTQPVAQTPPRTTPSTTPTTQPVAQTPPRTVPSATTPATSTAPAALSQALDDYLGGRFDVAGRLDINQFKDNRARFHALVVRAAARHVLAQVQGAAGAANLAAAQADIRAAKALGLNLTPDRVAFSPRFLALFAQTR
jgi:hypothetical protein